MSSRLIAAPLETTFSASQRLLAAIVAATLGLMLLFASGFASPELIHNAAHDWRHAHNFPCH